MSSKKSYLPLMLSIIILLLLFFLLKPSKESKLGDVSEIEMTLLNGEKLPFSKFQGNFFIIHVFSTWCNICKKDLYFIDHLRRHYNIPVVGMAIRDNLSRLKILESNELPYDYIVYENNDDILKFLGVSVLPETFIIDDKGQITLHLIGGVNQKRIHSKITPILKHLK